MRRAIRSQSRLQLAQDVVVSSICCGGIAVIIGWTAFAKDVDCFASPGNSGGVVHKGVIVDR